MAGYYAWLNPAIGALKHIGIRSLTLLDQEREETFDEISIAGLNVPPLLETGIKEVLRYVRLGAKYTRALRIELNAEDLPEEGYRIQLTEDLAIVEAGEIRGAFYGLMGFLRLVRTGEAKAGYEKEEKPGFSIRMINHWDNMDGSIERGYSGRSFFFDEGEVLLTPRIEDYACLLASLGINYVTINNVNVDAAASRLITDRHFDKLNQMFEIFSRYGVRPALSINYASPMELGGLDTADPLDPAVIRWWEEKAGELNEHLPLLAGVVIKADSEGRPGPFTYGRTQAEGANAIGRAFAAFHPECRVFWRAFVYNSQQDWRDTGTDRARAAFDYFSPLDSEFHENVTLQIKNGPMDFQVREPVSPLFCHMKNTDLTLELQIAQEYTGHQIDLCYLAPMWKEILGFETKRPDLTAAEDPRKKLSAQVSSIAAVANTGDDDNWFGSTLAGANLYAYGRLAWDPELSSEAILDEWLMLTFDEEQVRETLRGMMLSSWETYELYTAPLGIGWMVQPHLHYGPSVDGYEYDRWGTYHKADLHAIGVERGPNGTGYTDLYPKPWAEHYNNIDTCPDALVLFFHRLPYTHVLHSGSTVIQHIYDSRFEGLERVRNMAARWQELEGIADEETFANVSERFKRQTANAREWCDQVNSYFFRKTGIADEKGRMIY